jgi:hypothetical protein
MKRKASDTIQLSKIRMREDLRRRLAKDAERKGVTLNGEIVERLDRSYRDEDRSGELQQLEDRIGKMQQTLDKIAGKIFVKGPLGQTGQIASRPDLIATGNRDDEEDGK